MRFSALIAAAFLAGCSAIPTEPPTPSETAIVYVPLADDIYHFWVPVDPAHDRSSCTPVVPLTANQVPWNYSFTYYPCLGTAFNDRMKGPRGVKAVAEAEGKIFAVYRGVKTPDGRPAGKVVLLFTPRKKTEPRS